MLSASNLSLPNASGWRQFEPRRPATGTKCLRVESALFEEHSRRRRHDNFCRAVASARRPVDEGSLAPSRARKLFEEDP